ncbi:MAG TPA: Rrf2 family transcriptional regulator [Candidatus Binatia bacterium]|nr:Rrf2 family transcriptional regulator [Candidatus Binatia bacterium]
MLKVPQKVDHALSLMRLLAERQGTGAPLSLEDVAGTTKVSQGYLEEVARLLRAAKLIEGRRGAGGGYVLAKVAKDITVADVMVAIEGRTWTAECLGEQPKRAANDAVWRKVQGQVMTTLGAISIADVVAGNQLEARSSKLEAH